MVPPGKHLLPNAHGAIDVAYDFTEEVDGVPVRFLFGEAVPDGQLVCFRIEIGPSLDAPPGGLKLDNLDALRVQPPTTQTLRRIPVASMIEAHLLKLHQRIRDGEYLPHARETLEDGSTRIPDSSLRRLELEIGARAKRSAPSYRRPGRPQKYSREHYEEVARVYRANSGGRSPTKAVALHFDVSKSTAAKWVSHVRHGLRLPLGDQDDLKPKPRRRGSGR